MVNLYNGETRDFVKLWEIIYLKISTHFPSDKRNYSKLA